MSATPLLAQLLKSPHFGVANPVSEEYSVKIFRSEAGNFLILGSTLKAKPFAKPGVG